MRKILENYGAVIISILIIAGLMAIFLYADNKGFANIMGEGASSSISEENYSSFSDKKETDDITTKPPTIEYIYEGRILKTNTPIDVNSLFLSKSSYEASKQSYVEVPTKILSITFENSLIYYWEDDYSFSSNGITYDGNDRLIKKYVFEKPGVYDIKVEAIDDNSQKTEKTFQVSVDDKIE